MQKLNVMLTPLTLTPFPLLNGGAGDDSWNKLRWREAANDQLMRKVA